MDRINSLERDFEAQQALSVSEVVFRLAAGDEPTYGDLGYMSRQNYDDDEEEESGDEGQPALNLLSFLIEEPFKRTEVYPQRWNTRFPCFYAALERETSVAEMRHYAAKRVLATFGGTLHYLVFFAHFEGEVVDLEPLVDSYPELVDVTHNGYCHCVADAAHRRKLDGLHVQSVRYENGTCVPVYNQKSLSPGEIVAKVIFYRRKSDGDLRTRTIILAEGREMT